jgi:hypothetical protein
VVQFSLLGIRYSFLLAACQSPQFFHSTGSWRIKKYLIDRLIFID